MSDTLTSYETSPGALIVAIVDALRGKRMHCGALTVRIFGEMDIWSEDFSRAYQLVFRWLERLEEDKAVIRRKGKAAVLWELTE